MSEPIGREPDIRDQVRDEVSRRIELIRENPDVLGKYDRNGDGRLDDEEELVLRAVIEAEVVRDLDDSAPTTAEPSERPAPPEPHAWTIERESVPPALDRPVLEVIDARYDVLREIGAGSQGRTYLARRRDDGLHVALKELSFDNIDTWKSLELFEREGRVLRDLEHPAIPSFLDSFHVEVDDDAPRLFLVQEFVSGEGLDVSLAHGRHWSEAELRDFALQMLDILEHLHSQSPPVVHRDIKPSNIIHSAGTYRLVDFGAVQLVTPDDVGGSTVVGTTGFMPPEQLAGRALPASDLYALGATLVHMATHTHPAKLPAERLKIVWRERARVSHQFAAFIDRLIQPVAEDRISTASEARARLQTTAPPSSAVAPVDYAVPQVTRPNDADVRLEWEDETLVINMSKSIVTPIAIGGFLGLGVAAMVLVAAADWALAATIVIAGLLVGVFWPKGPDEVLRVLPSGGFHFSHTDRRSNREASGHIERFALDGSRLHLQSDAGALIEVGNHLSPQTRRWLFGTIDAHLRNK